jgi:hypothetical protein
MMEISHPDIEYKIAPPESLFIIGSNSIQASGELYTVGLNSIGRRENRRKKRMLDILTALFLLMVSPVLLWLLHERKPFFSNLFDLATGKLTLVGYAHEQQLTKLPQIRKGILNPLDTYSGSLPADEQTRHQANILYAKDYSVQHDLEILFSAWKKLGRP